MARTKTYHFTVEGSSPFPIDMLRYDRATPAREQDALEISASIDRMHPRQKRSVRLWSALSHPTDGRWESFGWRVTESSVDIVGS